MISLSLLRIIYLLCTVSETFAIEKLSFSVKEEEPEGSLVGILIHKLSNRLQNYKHRMNFQLIHKGHAEFFQISPQEGRITIAQVIDREIVCQGDNSQDDTGYEQSVEGQCQLRFTVSILREGTSEIIDMVQVIVNVLDVNDNRCRFEPSDHQTIYIPEDSPVDSGYRIPLYMPSDPDAGIMNRIDPRSVKLNSADDIDSSRYFDLHLTKTNSVTNPVSLQLTITRKLDYESFPTHKLLVTANDASRYESSTCSLHLSVQVIDANDNAPQFTKKHVHLSLNENTPVGSVVHQLQARDLDKGPVFSKLIYAFGPYTTKDVLSTFEILPFNGSIILKNRLSYAKRRKYETTITVRNPLDAEVVKGTYVDEPEIRISLATPLEATSHDTIQLAIDVIDVNDEAPAITFHAPDGDRELSIEENVLNLPSDFGLVSVTDGDSGDNGKVDCRLAENTTSLFQLVKMSYGDQMMDIGRETLFKLSAIHSFDREETQSITLLIICHDLGTPPRSTEKSIVVRIKDVNDNSPIFERQFVELNVTEDSDPVRRRNDFVIGQFSAHDPDEGANAEITYELLHTSGRQFFSINPKTGVFRSEGDLDRELQDRHQFTIVARDSGQPQLSTSITITINVQDFNDEPPVFALPEFEFVATEGAPLGTLIGKIDVTDGDEGINRELSFKILANDLSAHYPISSEESMQYDWRRGHSVKLPYRLESRFNSLRNMYEVSILTDTELDAEAVDEKSGYSSDGSSVTTIHSFFVVAEDGGLPKRISRSRIVVNILDINDNNPVFHFPTESNATVNVSYREYTGYPFTRVHATDEDSGVNGTVQYYLRSSQPQINGQVTSDQDFFQVDRTTGEVSLKAALSSSANNRVLHLYVVASDMGPQPLRSEAMLMILVDDSSPKGAQSGRPWTVQGFGKNGSMVNFVIIIFIVAAAFIIAAVLLTAVCIVFRKSRVNSVNSRIIPKKKGPFGTPFPVEPNDELLPDLESSQMLNGLGLPACTYTLSQSNGGKVYHAISLVAANDPHHLQWSPSSSTALVYTTNTMSAGGVNWPGDTGSGIFTLPETSYCSGNGELMHANTLPGVAGGVEGVAVNSTATYFPLACREPIWMGSQDHLSEQHTNCQFDGARSNDQDSGHGDSLDTNGNVFIPKASIQAGV